MIKNSILYHRWWYIKKRNIKKIRLLLRFVLAAIVICFAAFLRLYFSS